MSHIETRNNRSKGYEGKGLLEGVRFGIITGLFMNGVGWNELGFEKAGAFSDIELTPLISFGLSTITVPIDENDTETNY